VGAGLHLLLQAREFVVRALHRLLGLGIDAVPAWRQACIARSADCSSCITVWRSVFSSAEPACLARLACW
jgi:hypothetical protein